MMQHIRIGKWCNYLTLLLLIITIFTGCSPDNNDVDAYGMYESDFTYLRDNFSPANFNVCEELMDEYFSTSLPDNGFFNEKDDLYNNDPLKPKNRRLLYFSKDNNIAISVGYLFSEDNLDKSFVTIDSVPVDIINEQLDEKAYKIPPYLDQFVMTNEHSIILLKVIYIGNSNITDEERIKYTEYVKEFFTDFTDCLADKNN